MAMSAADLGGSAWFNSILNQMHGLAEAAGHDFPGMPIALRTRAVPTHLPVVLAEAQDGILLATLDSIPLYTYGASTKDRVGALYPSGTWTEVIVEQET